MNRGRPKNPYSIRSARWEPGSTKGWILDPSDIDGYPNRYIDLTRYARRLVEQAQSPVLRRVIEAILVFDHGYPPETVTDVLGRLTNPEDHYYALRVTPFKFGAEVNHLFTHGRLPSKAELTYLRAAYSKRQRALNTNALKSAGERYFREVLRQSGLYRDVTQRGRLGHVTDSKGKNALDIRAVSKTSGVAYGISVKNQRAWLFPGDRAIKDAFTKAKAHGVAPWLVVPFATGAARSRCERDGIRLTVLGRQIVPAEDGSGRPMRVVIGELLSVIGPQPFEYLYTRAARTFEQSGDAKHDAAGLRD